MAKVAQIDEVRAIPDADAISAYRVGGWWVVDRKNAYQVNDLVIYCEVDSWIPHSLAPFLSKGGDPKEFNGVSGNRLRTIRLRKQISQGLILSIDVLTGLTDNVFLGQDVSELFGIQKWEAPIPAQLAGDIRGLFPATVPKTDQERCQNLTSELALWKSLDFEVTEKLDGSSCTFFLDMEGEFHACSRNLDLKFNDTNSYWAAALKYDLDQKLASGNYLGFAVQGELIGPGIQGNPYKLNHVDFFVFDVYSVTRGTYLSANERIQFCNDLGLRHVPVLNIVPESLTVDYLLEIAEGKSVLNGNTEREGLVFKCLSNPDIHFKAISNRFLLKSGG
jgi:RNA ligase (TIGR02306 family)